MKKQLKTFLAAISYYTRIPCKVQLEESHLSGSIRYFPMIGWITGISSALVFWAGNYLFDRPIAVILAIVSSVLLTGAIHEDGFADVCDGFGGGWTREKILAIMKDSRVGAYGVLGVCLILLLRFLALEGILNLCSNQPSIELSIIVSAHSFSRFNASTLIYKNNYVRETENSKASFVSQKNILKDLTVASTMAALPFILLLRLAEKPLLLLLIPVLFLIRTYLRNFFRKWIGGYTGDCLGAVQLITEVSFYLFLIPLWKFTL
ncbi:adenosylcobinamide-GDP ribazoletransferase [Desertivirga arenae]|uniref:adenosylcobinamide-GDP ribazoletransferase n=1 Tax=Desertivirga arenae TaxID=2810309 RepID=UPI001A9582C2|nr:adenosylcobinamide-GDP ribazoletransferase [Pedobacter sp. SYSU D00823]